MELYVQAVDVVARFVKRSKCQGNTEREKRAVMAEWTRENPAYQLTRKLEMEKKKLTERREKTV